MRSAGLRAIHPSAESKNIIRAVRRGRSENSIEFLDFCPLAFRQRAGMAVRRTNRLGYFSASSLTAP